MSGARMAMSRSRGVGSTEPGGRGWAARCSPIRRMLLEQNTATCASASRARSSGAAQISDDGGGGPSRKRCGSGAAVSAARADREDHSGEGAPRAR